jgi:hypothetical protein
MLSAFWALSFQVAVGSEHNNSAAVQRNLMTQVEEESGMGHMSNPYNAIGLE